MSDDIVEVTEAFRNYHLPIARYLNNAFIADTFDIRP